MLLASTAPVGAAIMQLVAATTWSAAPDSITGHDSVDHIRGQLIFY